MNKTIDYYDKNAQEYYRLTVDVDMSSICDKFLGYVKSGGKIIDIGSGSGRDIKYFLNKGYEAKGIDASTELCQICKKQGLEIENTTIQDWTPKERYDGIWANASLLHISLYEIESFLIKAKYCLNEDGVIFISMKEGLLKEYDDKGRFFCHFDESVLSSILQKLHSFEVIEKWHTADSLSRSGFKWLNFMLK